MHYLTADDSERIEYSRICASPTGTRIRHRDAAPFDPLSGAIARLYSGFPTLGHFDLLPMRPSFCLAAMLLVPALCAAQDIKADSVKVKVQRHGEAIVVDVEAHVAAPVKEAWAVFTDYDHMSAFISNIKHSKVLARDGNRLEVEQAGETRVAFMRFGFLAVRAIELTPMQEIHSSLVSGDFKAYQSTTQVTATPTGAKITHHGEYVPTSWMPPLIGPAMIESETRKQYLEFIAEIERRATAPNGP